MTPPALARLERHKPFGKLWCVWSHKTPRSFWDNVGRATRADSPLEVRAAFARLWDLADEPSQRQPGQGGDACAD